MKYELYQRRMRLLFHASLAFVLTTCALVVYSDLTDTTDHAALMSVQGESVDVYNVMTD